MNTVLAIDLGATNLRIAHVYGKDVWSLEKKPTPKVKTNKELIEKLAEIIGRYIEKYQIDTFVPIGMAVAGPIIKEKEKIVFLTEIIGEFVSFIELEKKLGREIELINDADAAVLAEYKYGVGSRNLAYITISSGIGAGVIKKGKLVPGEKTEVGHFEIEAPYNMMCNCDGVNHWEAFTSGKRIAAFFTEWSKGRKEKIDKGKYDSVYKIFDLIREKDKVALEFSKEVHRINAQGITKVDKKFNPKKIVLGGGVALNCRNIIMDGLRANLPENVFKKISITNLGDEVSLLGVGVNINKY